MGNKRKRSKQKAGPGSSNYHGKAWPDRFIDELLSYLNSQVAFLDPATETPRERDLEDVDQEIARHLNCIRDREQDSLKPPRSYSAKQVRAELSRLYAMHKLTEDDDEDWKVIYMQGFDCLDWTDASERKLRMVRRSNGIKHNWKWEFLHSPRRTRASSQVNSNLRNAPVRIIRASSSASNLRSRMEKSRVTGSHPLRQTSEIDCVQHVSDTGSLAGPDRDSSFIKSEDTTQKYSVMLTTEPDDTQRLRPFLEDSQEISESEPEAFGSSFRSCGPASSDNNASDTRTLGESPSTRNLAERLCIVEKELQTVKRKAGLEIDFWKAKYSKAQHERSRWKKAKNVLAAELNALRSPSGSKLCGDELVEREALLDDLLEERNSRERIQNLKLDTDTQPDDETILKVSELMQDNGSRLKAALEYASFSPVAELRELPQEHPLRSLVEQAFSVDSNSPEIMALLEYWRNRPELRQYGLLSLCGAALASWVFQQTQADILFDRYQAVGTRSSTNRYRDAIKRVGHCDPVLAREVDLEVHNSLANEDCFEYFQRAKGRNLARRLQKALAPLCELDQCTEEQSNADSEVEGYVIDHLSEVFFNAIDVQCRLVLSGWRYECVWHEPGVRFDSKIMSSTGTKEKFGTTDTLTVKMTLLPGINQVKAGRVGVDFSGFAERRHRDHDETVCIVQAVVLRENRDLH